MRLFKFGKPGGMTHQSLHSNIKNNVSISPQRSFGEDERDDTFQDCRTTDSDGPASLVPYCGNTRVSSLTNPKAECSQSAMN